MTGYRRRKSTEKNLQYTTVFSRKIEEKWGKQSYSVYKISRTPTAQVYYSRTWQSSGDFSPSPEIFVHLYHLPFKFDFELLSLLIEACRELIFEWLGFRVVVVVVEIL
jgi:hypothetical protein